MRPHKLTCTPTRDNVIRLDGAADMTMIHVRKNKCDALETPRKVMNEINYSTVGRRNSLELI